MHQPNLEVNQSLPYNSKSRPPIIPSRSLYSQTGSLHVNGPPLPQPSLEVNRSQPRNTKSPAQSNQSQPINQEFEQLMSPPANRTPVTSSSTVGNGDNDHQIWIVPEEDGFDPHKIVIDGIASCIRSKFELARPSWKKFPQSTHDMWFEEFKKKFKWLPHYTDAIRRNFEKRASARMTQLFQDVRKNLPLKPHWMGDAKESTGKDPSISEFYFRTHRKKSDKTWVNEKTETAYNTFERKKQELLASQSALASEGETNLTGQPSQLTEMDIWVQSVGGKKKGRVKGLGYLGRSVKSSSKQSTSALSREIDEMIKAQVNASNADLYAQLQKERHKNKRMRRELDLLKKHVYNASSSNEQSSQEDNQAYENESGDDSDSVNDSGSAHDNVNDSGSAHYSASSSNRD
ncbi:hypothetical protein KY290_005330 [Solanum tuberosum]|uniref:Transposase, Ptta/En/Spm, plant n=1 Tax=Solanum tuberosum TaxID=4113 RepID=A0ABQ7WFM9_SOLTU|nr:hypothetical protein KY289_005715 [Solanum tuberosum]KAH0778903.1 hypothetical protein KY290_005330 [Solanum tuberosum]